MNITITDHSVQNGGTVRNKQHAAMMAIEYFEKYLEPIGYKLMPPDTLAGWSLPVGKPTAVGQDDGLVLAYDIVLALHDEIAQRHHKTASFLGFPTSEHHRLIGGSRALKELSQLLLKAHREQLAQ